MNAFSGTYPDAHVTECYFHLCQSVIRKVNEIGLKMEYETNDEVRCLPALAFIPPCSRLNVARLTVALLSVAAVNCRSG